MGIVQRNSITITILSYLGILIGYVNKILLLTNFLTEEQVGLVNILTGLAVLYAQFCSWRSANRSWRTIRKNLRYCPSTT